MGAAKAKITGAARVEKLVIARTIEVSLVYRVYEREAGYHGFRNICASQPKLQSACEDVGAPEVNTGKSWVVYNSVGARECCNY